MPGDECGQRAVLDAVEKLRGRFRMGMPVEGRIDEDVDAEKHQRYFRASASQRGSRRPAGLNRPRSWRVGARSSVRSSEGAAGSDPQELAKRDPGACRMAPAGSGC